VALLINTAPAAAKKKKKKIKAKQLSSSLKNKLGTNPAFKSVNGKVPNDFNEQRLYSLTQTATYSWKQHNMGDRGRMSYSKLLLLDHFKIFILHLYASECVYRWVTSAVVMQSSEFMHKKKFHKIIFYSLLKISSGIIFCLEFHFKISLYFCHLRLYTLLGLSLLLLRSCPEKGKRDQNIFPKTHSRTFCFNYISHETY